MNFLNPLVLIGLIAAAIPLILHLLNLRKLKKIEFSTLQFLKELKKQQIKKLKIKQLLLLLLRTLIIICLVLAFSRPVVESKLPVFEAYAKSSAVIILDNSVSMDINEERGNRFSLAKIAVMNIIEMLSDGSEISIIEMSEPFYANSTLLMQDYSYLKKKISDIKISYKKGDLVSSLNTANSILSSAKNINKEIFIISDMQNNIFNVATEDSVSFKKMDAKIYAVQIGKTETDPKNISLDSLEITNRIIRNNTQVNLDLVLKNHSSQSADGTLISLFFNNRRVAQKTVDVNHNSTTKVSISAIPNEFGAISGEVEIDGDALDQDNKRYFAITIPERIKVLVLGAPNNNLSVFFQGVEKIQSIFSADFSNEITAESYDLNKYDVVLLNDGQYSKSFLDRLIQYVKTGGYIYIYANSITNNAIFNNFLKQIGYGKLNERSNPSMNAIEFSKVDKLHPLLEGVFKGTTDSRKPIETPLLKKYSTVQSGYSIISFQSGAFLAEEKYGKGKTLYCGTGISDEWGNFALSGLFPTLLYRGLIYLSNTESIQKSYIIDEQILFKLPNEISSQEMIKVLDPDKYESFYRNMYFGSESVIELSNLTKCGNYSVVDNTGKIKALASVNMNPNESEINLNNRREKVSSISKWFKDNSAVSYIEDTKDLTNEIVRQRLGTELWKVFALMALIFAIAEMLISRFALNDQ